MRGRRAKEHSRTNIGLLRVNDDMYVDRPRLCQKGRIIAVLKKMAIGSFERVQFCFVLYSMNSTQENILYAI